MRAIFLGVFVSDGNGRATGLLLMVALRKSRLVCSQALDMAEHIGGVHLCVRMCVCSGDISDEVVVHGRKGSER